MKNNNTIRITACTCTYNRKELLVRMYDSIKQQTYRDFEWIVYNNGSTDGTEELVRSWIGQNDFPIRYLSTPTNTGYQNAFNAAIEVGVGEFFITLDDDDAIVPNAFERMLAMWDTIPDDEKHEFVGVTSNCITQHGTLDGTEFPTSPFDSTPPESTYKYKVKGEKFGMLRRDVMLEFPFQRVPHHVQQLAIWSKISKKYRTRYFNESLRIYYIADSGRTDQVSKNESMHSLMAYGSRHNTQYALENDMNYFFYSPVEFLKHAVFYKKYSSLLGISIANQFRDLSTTSSRLLYIFAIPVSWGLDLVRSFR